MICEGVVPEQVATHADDGVASRVQANVALQHTLIVFVIFPASITARRRCACSRFTRFGHRSVQKTLHNTDHVNYT